VFIFVNSLAPARLLNQTFSFGRKNPVQRVSVFGIEHDNHTRVHCISKNQVQCLGAVGLFAVNIKQAMFGCLLTAQDLHRYPLSASGQSETNPSRFGQMRKQSMH
jgi:hypothetical protein